MRYLLFITIAMLLVAACVTQQPEPISTPLPPTDTSIPPTQVTQPIDVTFDGMGCTVTGPTELPMGEHQFILRDLSENDAELTVQYFVDGKTTQDYLDLQSDSGAWFEYQQNTWAQPAIMRGTEWNELIDGKEYTYLLNEEGEYVILVSGYSPRSVWICAPLWVIESPSD